ncbi:Cation/H(+) antiporter 20 [Dichanthelium oligosanthes]|uniref:Cation/H(+) antiporter 20 n=1 Tax=Dichanthelium oligosanthes TaxID=888268 RepID=A0A1E5W227_9POAL|nr:Cation/H(+) antiporter 20 [Dichanthelium oligosanthes]
MSSSSPPVSAAEMAAVKTSSNGVWQGDDPLHFAFPLLILQALLILVLSRVLAFLLRPLRQPKVIAEKVVGILLGPSALGRNKAYLRALFPPWSAPVLESVASLGLLFFLFLVGLELDLRSVRRSGRRAFAIAAAGISLPFACGVGVAFVLRRAIPGADQAGYAPFLVFMGVALSITAFPVLARILAELKLLTTPIGETALAAAAFNDVAAWVLLALAVAISGTGGGHGPITSLWVLLCSAAFVAAWMVAVKPAMGWVARRADAAGEGGGEVWVAVTLAGVMASGFATDLIGIHAIFGAFVFGLTVPKEGAFAGRVTARVEDLVAELLLPLYFASSGLKTDVATIRGGEAWGMLALVIGTACAGKIAGTFGVAMACGMSAREAVVLGVVMNTKGLVELIVLNIGRERKVLNEETFAILVLMALVTTFITTPTVMAIYKPARAAGRRRLHHRKLQGAVPSAPSSPSASTGAGAAKELRVLACIHGGQDVPALINLIETIRGHTQPRRLVKLYILRMVELTERTSSILMVRAARRNGLPFLRPRRAGEPHDQVDVAFDTYAQLGHVSVRAMTAVSALHTIHDDVAAVAEDKRVSLVVLPFHKRQTEHGDDVENLGPEWRAVNRRILREAPCSVAVLVDRGFGGGEQVSSEQVAHGVCVVFFGGPDDREALELAGRMAEHPGVQVTVVRFVDGKAGSGEQSEVTLRPSHTKNADRSYTFSTAVIDTRKEKELDEAAVAEFRQRMGSLVRFEERVVVGNVIEEVVSIGKSREYGLVVVGKGRLPSAMVAQLAVRPAEHPELGPIGDALASSGHGVTSSVLVVQQHDMSNADEVPVSVVVDGHAHDGEFAKDMAEP